MGKGKASPAVPKGKAGKASVMKVAPKAVMKSAMKKPVASASLLRRMNAMQEEPEEEPEQSIAARDKGKAVKFTKMKNSNSLPAFVIDLIEEQSKSSSAPRSQKTLLINKLFKRLPDGSLELALDQPVFIHAEKAYRKKYARDEAEAIPASVMCGLYFHNSEQHMQRAIDKGEIVEARRENGVIFYGFRRFVIGTEDGKEESQSTKASKKLTAEEHQLLRSVFKNLKWSFEFTKKEAIVDDQGQLSGSVETLLKQAAATLEKTSREAKQLMAGWKGSGDTLAELKGKYGPTINFAAEIAHIRDLNKFSDGTDISKDAFIDWMKMVATKTDALNICIQKARAEIKFLK
ncbi:unnamed protein product [Symbiodinium sp. CCMP2592]|nr:unnamed protein product [Symbiodinium sp. CCMP2592]